MHRRLGSGWLRATVAVTVLTGGAVAVAGDPCAVVALDGATPGERAAVAAAAGWWVELGPSMVVCGEVARGDGTPVAPVRERLGEVDRDRLWVARGVPPSELVARGFRVLATHRGYAVLEAVAVERLPDPSADRRHPAMAPLPPDTVVLRRVAPDPKAVDPEIQAVVDQLDGARWFAAVDTLQQWDRYTHRTEVLDARDWLVARFAELPGMQVSTPSFQVGGTTASNVMAVLAGSTRPDDIYIVGGHYDATSSGCGVGNPAYGAEDNASGAAGVLEMARVLAFNPPDATVVFVAYGGEEQGLYGSEDHVADLTASGDLADVQGVVIMDMIAYSVDATRDVLLETDDPDGVAQLNLMAQAAADYTSLGVHQSFFWFGSDHVPFLQQHRPAVLTIEDDWDQYVWYHCTTDTIDKLVQGMGEEILRMNVASVALMAGARPPGVLFEDGFESGDAGAWSDPAPAVARE